MSVADDVFADLAAGAKGAAAGMVLGPVGAGVGGLLGVAMAAAPGVAQWLGGSADAAEKAVAAVRTVTGTSDPAAANAALADPILAGDLRVQLAQIAADREREMREADLDSLKAALGDVAGARAQTLALAQAGSSLSWGAPVVSVVVVAMFGILAGLLLFRAVPEGSAGLLNILLGSLSSMATAVVTFWIGSSAGSERKTNLLARSVPSEFIPHPPNPGVTIPAADVRSK